MTNPNQLPFKVMADGLVFTFAPTREAARDLIDKARAKTEKTLQDALDAATEAQGDLENIDRWTIEPNA